MVSIAGTPHEHDDRAGRGPSGRVLVMDRSREFAAARRHSYVVRTLRLLLPVSAILIATGYVLVVVSTARIGAAIDRSGRVATVSRELTMDNPRYQGTTRDGGAFLVTARTALPDFANAGRVKLNDITGELVDIQKRKTDFKAAKGVFDGKTNAIDLSDGITVVTDTGMRAELQTASIATREGVLRSNTPVRVVATQGDIRSNRLEIDQKTKRVAFMDDVVAKLVPPPAGPSPVPPAPAAGPASGSTPFGAARSPVDVTADRLEIDDVGKTAVFIGNVRAGQVTPADAGPQSTIETARLEIAYLGAVTGQPTSTQDAGERSAPAPAAPPTKIERILAPQSVVMTQSNGARITGNSAEFDVIGEVAVVAGSVVMTTGTDRRASAERVEFNQKIDTILLTGDVVVTQAENELRGRRLFVDRRAGRTDLSSPADGALGKSRIFARLTQGGGAAKAPTKAPVQTAANAQDTGGLGFATFKTDPTAPVEIEADRLAVEDMRKEAIFTGDVRAAQGDFLLRSTELKATYAGETGLVVDPAASRPVAGQAPKNPAQLQRIDAKGKVVVTSKASQQVTGDWAIFDTKANTVTVGGADVVLTQGPNVVKGSKLLIDMTTGQSVMTRETAAGTSSTPVKPGRSSVIFYPSSQDKKAAGATGTAPSTTAPPKPSSSSWGATAEPATPR